MIGTNRGEQATSMERLNKCISSGIRGKNGIEILCRPKSIRCMAAKTHFDEGLLHGLCSMIVAINAIVLGTVSYSEMQESGWPNETDWVQDIARDGNDWILPIRDGNHWQPVRISWCDRQILCYSPVCSLQAEKRSQGILKVGRHLDCC
jgi:hypothetical protein